MSPNPEARQVAGFVVHHLPEAERVAYLRPDGPGVDVDVDLSDRVSCTLRLMPAVALHAIVVRHDGERDARPADVELAERVARTPELGPALDAYATALEAAGTPGAGRVWVIELALRALEVIDRLDLRAADAEETGVWLVWSTMCATAAQALAEVPDPARYAGDSALWADVVTMTNRLQPRADRLASEWLDAVARWPRPEADRPAEGDQTMAELERAPGIRKRVRLGGPVREEYGAAVTLNVDLEALERIGLVDPMEQVVARRLRHEGDRAWEVRIRLRDEVATTFAALTKVWDNWRRRPGRTPGKLPPDVRQELACAFAAVLAETHLPYTLDDFLRAAALTTPTPPHLADVVCLVRAGEATGPVGLREADVPGDSVVLVATIPHRGRPSAQTVSFTIRPGRTPMVSASVRTIAQRMLALRQELAEGAVPVAGTVRQLKAVLDDKALKAALDAEVAAGPRRLTAEVRTLVEAIRSSQAALVPALRAAAHRRDLAAVERLAAQVSRTRAYLSGVTD